MLDELARDLQKVAVDGRAQSLKNELYMVERAPGIGELRFLPLTLCFRSTMLIMPSSNSCTMLILHLITVLICPKLQLDPNMSDSFGERAITPAIQDFT